MKAFINLKPNEKIEMPVFMFKPLNKYTTENILIIRTN